MHGVMNKTYDFPTAFSCWGDEERSAIDRVLTSGKLTQGDEVEALEVEFAQYHGMKHGIAVNSGSSANLIIVAALFARRDNPLQRGDEVLVPALAWSTTYAPLVQHGLRLRLLDCDDTWCGSLSQTTVDNSRLVVGCSILGNPAPLEFLNRAADAAGAYMIEDNCESLGAWHGNCRTGTYGLMNSFSFFYSHQISAVEGGMILTNDGECAKLCRMLRAHGWTRDVQPPATFEQEYDFAHFGYNVRTVEMHAAVAREQLKKLQKFIDARKKNVELFRTLTTDLPIKHPLRRGEQSPFSLHFEVVDRETRLRLVSALRSNSIDCRLPTGGSVSRHAYGRHWSCQSTLRADQIHDCGLFLGNGPIDLTEQIGRAVEVMRGVL